ncbi:MAG: Hsp70 family protein [bacterium]|nr:Hsp70 family protein [bacterium]
MDREHSNDDYCVGIDLGTTNTVCAVWERGRDGPEMIDITQPVDFTSGAVDRSRLLPSALSIQQEGLFVGKAARQALCLGRGKTFTSTKRNMGKPWLSPTEFDWTPERVAGAVLSVVHQELGRRYGTPPLRVVITVPASFGTEARRATLLAARLAGFDAATVRLFDEPTAALLAELQQNSEYKLTAEPRRVMAIDIGGGTLDVTLVTLHREGGRTVFDVQGQSRLNTLAGDDFDLNIAGLLLKRFLDDRKLEFQLLDRLSKIRLCSDLLLRAEEVKTRLSVILRGEKPSAWGKFREPVVITETPDRQAWRTELHGQDLAAALLEYFPLDDNVRRRREEVTFFRPIQECLDAARGITGETVEPAEAWLAGGSAYLPFIPFAIRKILDIPCRIVSEPMHAIALGAAWFAGLHDFGDGEMTIRERMFEGIYLQTADQSFVEMVGARELVPMARIERPDLLAMPMADLRVEVDLFVGHDGPSCDTKEVAPKLMPLARRRISFPELLPREQRISVGVEVTANREVLFDFSTHVAGRQLAGQVTASLAYGGDSAGAERRLPPINQRPGGNEG